MKIVRTSMFAKASRTYAVSKCGQQFLGNPSSVYVFAPLRQNDQKNREKAKNTGRSNSRESRHHLPKIRSLLKSSSSWFISSKKEDYEYPGYTLANAEGTFVIVKTLRIHTRLVLAQDLITRHKQERRFSI